MQYFFRRLLFLLPTLLIISLLSFGLSQMAPGDPVELLLRAGGGPAESSLLDAERVYRQTSALLGLDKAPFYFSLTSSAYPDTLYRFPDKDHRANLKRLIARHGNWEKIEAYYHQLRRLDQQLRALPPAVNAGPSTELSGRVRQLYLEHRSSSIQGLLQGMDSLAQQSDTLFAIAGATVRDLQQSFQQVVDEPRRSRLYIPDIKWYGTDNQYHHWFIRFIRGDFGISYTDGRPVAYKLRDAIRWTLLLNVVSILLAYLLSIPLGVHSAVRRGSTFDRGANLVLFLLYSLPVFWIATLLVVFLTTPEYGLDLFPTMGIGATGPDVPFLERFLDRIYHIALPVFCLTYSSLAFIARQVRGAMLDTLGQDYIRTARAKGLPERRVIWRHAFPNSLFPVITLFSSVFPAVLAGSVIIEVIFNIPGMGKLTIDAISQSNWPVVYAVLMLGAILTIAGMLIADLLYALADPRVTFRR